jgi:hypothetical protein
MWIVETQENLNMASDLYSVPPAPDHVRDAYFADFANRDPLPLTLDLVERLFYLMPHHFGLELDFAIAQRQPLSEAGVLVHRAIRQNDNWLRIVVGLGSRLSLTDVLTMPSDELTMAAAHTRSRSGSTRAPSSSAGTWICGPIPTG